MYYGDSNARQIGKLHMASNDKRMETRQPSEAEPVTSRSLAA